MATLRFICLMMLLLFCTACLSFEHALPADGNEDARLDVVSARKGIADVAMKRTIRGRKMDIEGTIGNSKVTSGNGQFNKQVTKVMNIPNTKKSKSVGHGEVDEDGLVAFTADYWRARHHPPKNN